MELRSFALAGFALGTIACNERSPVVPIPQSTAAITPTAPTAFQSFGVVRDSRGSPMAGAAVSFWPELSQKLFSNEAGQFEIPVGQDLELVYASKPDYESAIADVSPGVQLTLHDIIRIPAGQSARVTVRPDDSLGGYGLRYRVRTIRVSSNGDRIVRIQLLADDNGPVDYRVPELCGDLCPPNSPPTFFIDGGGERRVQIHVPANSMVSRTFTLITSAEEP